MRWRSSHENDVKLESIILVNAAPLTLQRDLFASRCRGRNDLDVFSLPVFTIHPIFRKVIHGTTTQ